MFLIDYFDEDRYSNYEVAIVLQNRMENINYLWNGLYYFDIPKMKNLNILNWNLSSHCDTGGMTQEWLKLQSNGKKIPNVNDIRWSNKTFTTKTIYYIKHLWSCSWDEKEMPDIIKKNTKLHNFICNDPRNINNKYFCEIYDNIFLHYRAGGNWRQEGMILHNILSNILKEALVIKNKKKKQKERKISINNNMMSLSFNDFINEIYNFFISFIK
jgi:hypothetical protein